MQIVPAPGLTLEILPHAEIFSVRVIGTSRWAACPAHELAETISLLCSEDRAPLDGAPRWARIVMGELSA